MIYEHNAASDKALVDDSPYAPGEESKTGETGLVAGELVRRGAAALTVRL